MYRHKRLPEKATPVGYAALIEAFALEVPLPRQLSAVQERHRREERGGWQLFAPQYAPEPSVEGHLTFALKYEGLDLAVLKRLFERIDPSILETIVRETPTGKYSRRLWFLYEWLLDRRLDLPDASQGNYVPAVDPNMQFAVDGANSRRHRVRDNLPGTPQFCPLVYRSERLDAFLEEDLSERAREVVDDVPADLLARTAAFLLLKDSQSSYAIEGEQAPQDRVQRWGRAIGQAGQHPIDTAELKRLQKLVIGDARFVKLGVRNEEGFVGEHARGSHIPLPVHISARPQDLGSLIDGLVDFAHGPAARLDPVVAAAVLAFGFVYVHPFEDGNGRLHRYLIHHVLSRRDYHPPGMVFPVSAAILRRVDEYKAVLESYSERLLQVIDWSPSADGNVEVRNATADFYRFFDATPHAEFLYACVEQTIAEDLPQETRFLQQYDRFKEGVERLVDMPDSTIDLLFQFLNQNEGRLSKRARQGEFAALEPEEVREIESLYSDSFGQ